MQNEFITVSERQRFLNVINACALFNEVIKDMVGHELEDAETAFSSVAQYASTLPENLTFHDRQGRYLFIPVAKALTARYTTPDDAFADDASRKILHQKFFVCGIKFPLAVLSPDSCGVEIITGNIDTFHQIQDHQMIDVRFPRVVRFELASDPDETPYELCFTPFHPLDVSFHPCPIG